MGHYFLIIIIIDDLLSRICSTHRFRFFFHCFNIFTIYGFLLVYKSSMLVYFHDFLVYKNVYYIFIIFKISFKYIKVRCWDYSPNSFFCWCIFNIFLYIKMCTLFNINHLYLKKKKNKKNYKIYLKSSKK